MLLQGVDVPILDIILVSIDTEEVPVKGLYKEWEYQSWISS